jgi:hypothetical protein
MYRAKSTIVTLVCLVIAGSAFAFDAASARGSGHSSTSNPTSNNKVSLDTITTVPMHQAAVPHSPPTFPVPTFTSVAGALH